MIRSKISGLFVMHELYTYSSEESSPAWAFWVPVLRHELHDKPEVTLSMTLLQGLGFSVRFGSSNWARNPFFFPQESFIRVN